MTSRYTKPIDWAGADPLDYAAALGEWEQAVAEKFPVRPIYTDEEPSHQPLCGVCANDPNINLICGVHSHDLKASGLPYKDFVATLSEPMWKDGWPVSVS